MNALHIQLTNGPVHCFDSQGSGITVLLLHGNSSAAEAFGAQFAALGRRHRLLALDLPGHGQSAAATPEHYSFAGYADALVQAIEHLQLEDYLIVGHSLGGHAALEALPRLPGLRGLCLIGAPPFNSGNAGQLFCTEPTGGLVFQAELDDQQVTRLANAFVNPEHLEQRQLASLARYIRATDPQVRAALGASLSSGAFADEVALLAASGVPTLLVQGTADAFIDARACTQAAVFAPAKLSVALFDDCGHCPHLEDPARFNDLLDTFITHTCENTL
ncbi:alpha/beta fold hydrolase [Pseudomonas anguilliseptica]|uniref:alpha/beta fold hydrolase n=1 Tax=Pseudomonas anguilliseptica TaxID=53406 RepID=UPI00373556FA